MYVGSSGSMMQGITFHFFTMQLIQAKVLFLLHASKTIFLRLYSRVSKFLAKKVGLRLISEGH